jgi:hypothetical protein
VPGFDSVRLSGSEPENESGYMEHFSSLRRTLAVLADFAAIAKERH